MEKLLVSFSGGRTSAYMSKLIHDRWGDAYDIKYVFANTGCEHEKTLEFIQRCDIEFDLGVVWIEACVKKGRQGTGFKIVDFNTASRKGRPFKDVCKKYGLPNQSYPHCTRELKLQPISAYLKHIGFDGCKRAVGIRADEPRRRSKTANKLNIIYPLMDVWPTDKEDVAIFWEGQTFDLDIPSYLGNCVWCWKKSDKKHFRILLESPRFYDVAMKLEKKYSRNGRGSDLRDLGARKMFRGHRNVDDMKAGAALACYFSLVRTIDDLEPGGCTSSCDI